MTGRVRIVPRTSSAVEAAAEDTEADLAREGMEEEAGVVALKTTMRLAGVVVTMIAGEVAMTTAAAGVAIEVIHAVNPEIYS